jgi:hypothetical protein
MTDTLITDADVVYHPALFNVRLVLGPQAPGFGGDSPHPGLWCQSLADSGPKFTGRLRARSVILTEFFAKSVLVIYRGFVPV